jgi:hypothetical protein
MPYKFDLEEDFERQPFRNARGDEIISFILGENAEAQIMVFMTVRLICQEPGVYHIDFGIEERDAANNNQSGGVDYSREHVKRYVPIDERSVVLQAILGALSCMLDKVNPGKVTMRTFYKSLPEKALKKYEKISYLMVARGYEVKEEFPEGTTGNPGRRYWLYKQLPTGNPSATVSTSAEET